MSREDREGFSNAEYYFEYKIRQIGGDFDIDTPKLYFEWDVIKQCYSLFAVPKEWLKKQDIIGKIRDVSDGELIRRELDVLPYDTICSIFDIRGTECSVLADDKSAERAAAEAKREISFESFYENGCRVMIESQNAFEHSGVGVLEFKKSGKIIATFFFAINFTMKKRIEYSLKLNGKELRLKFYCPDRPIGIRVRVARNIARVPCLRNDMNNDNDEVILLDFSAGSKYSPPKITVPSDIIGDGARFSLGFVDADVAKFYTLECVGNSTFPKKSRFEIGSPQMSCPYCHKPIKADVGENSAYKHDGGISCQGKLHEKIYGRHDTLLKKTLYCDNDLAEKGFQLTFSRLLPMGFASRKTFKVAFTGSTRAGKTTYISRFFGITGTESSVSMPMPMLASALKRIGVNIKTASIPSVVSNGENKYSVGDKDWTGTSTHYTERAISLDPPRYPQPTMHSNDYIHYPFIADVDGKAYVSFYDIAGEDAQDSTLIGQISGESYIGVFCIINGKRDERGNRSVIKQLVEAGIPKNSPIAFIVTKMDTLENEFDPNCYCLRNDYFDGDKTYAGSYLERVIEHSSEEIRSYLMEQGMEPNIGGQFNNVKYFGISSFNFKDSIHDDMADINTPGEVRFECSSKRIELPFIWMLKQFGLI